MHTLPTDLRAKVTQRRTVLRTGQRQPFAGQPPAAENPRAVLARLCAWARILGPLAADRGIAPDLTLTTTTYTPPPQLFGRIPLKRGGGKIDTKPGKKGYKLFPVVDDPSGVGAPIRHASELLPRDRGVVLTPAGQLILVKPVRGQWADHVRSLDITSDGVDFGDGMGTGNILPITPRMTAVPRALELLGGLAAVEGGLVHFATFNNLDK